MGEAKVLVTSCISDNHTTTTTITTGASIAAAPPGPYSAAVEIVDWHGSLLRRKPALDSHAAMTPISWCLLSLRVKGAGGAASIYRPICKSGKRI
ncbi:hypothetical protein E2C01_074127 [Portunus trituberculatus]|uniref:Uncharacterized protein n=1 Tax=Portunus trituberculatus TaxID=210409 RepID=A0A5B7I777_PORTR|nr:hypothetical protein [Portunus trituberculatus]